MVRREAGDPRELRGIWMPWEEGETSPGAILSDLEAHGVRELLDALAEQLDAAEAGPEVAGGA